MRNTLDISAVPMLKKMTHLPVVIDPATLRASPGWWSPGPGGGGRRRRRPDDRVHNDPAHARIATAPKASPRTSSPS